MFTDQTYTLFLNQANALLPQVGHQMCGPRGGRALLAARRQLIASCSAVRLWGRFVCPSCWRGSLEVLFFLLCVLHMLPFDNELRSTYFHFLATVSWKGLFSFRFLYCQEKCIIPLLFLLSSNVYHSIFYCSQQTCILFH